MSQIILTTMSVSLLLSNLVDVAIVETKKHGVRRSDARTIHQRHPPRQTRQTHLLTPPQTLQERVQCHY